MKIIIYIFIFLSFLFFNNCGGGGSKSSNSTYTPSQIPLKSCIVDVVFKSDITSGASVCFEEFPEDACNELDDTPEDDAFYDSYMLADSCQDLNYDSSTLTQITYNGNTYHQYVKQEAISKYTHTQIDGMFPKLDTSTLLKNPPATKITSKSKNAVVNITASNDALLLSKTDIIDESETTISLVYSLDSSYIGKPIFIENIFKGLIDTVYTNKITLKNASNIREVFNSLEIDVSTDTLSRSLQRAIDNGVIQGQYDRLNKQPLKISIVQNSNARTLESEPVLRLEFPQGYKVPINTRALDCSFWDASCQFTINSLLEDKKDLSLSTDADRFIVFSTKGSYIEYKIGTKLKMFYDKNWGADKFSFTFAQNAGFAAVLEFNINAEATALSDAIAWEKNFQPLGDFEIEIVHPSSHLIKTSVIVAPTVTLGIEGKLAGAVGYKTPTIIRSGEIRVEYDSTYGTNNLYSTIKDESSQLGEDGLKVELEASANAYCFPNMIFVPSLKALRIDEPITLVELRSGVKLDNTLQGKIEKGFTASSEGILVNTAGEVSVTSSISGLAQGKFSVKIGDDLVFYESEDFSDIIKTPDYKIFEWKMQLLDDPQIVLKQDSSDPNIKLLSFTNNDISIRDKIYYYYTIDVKDDSSTDIDLTKLSKYDKWYEGKSSIKVKGEAIVKVLAVLNNKDISTSAWAFGQSLSKQVKQKIGASVLEPVIYPDSKDFTDSLTVSISQAQNYDIFYRLNGGTTFQYTTPFQIFETTTVEAIARSNDGETVSEVVSEKYSLVSILCDDGEIYQDGICVADTSDNTDTGDTTNSDGTLEITLPYDCPAQRPSGLSYGFYIEPNGTVYDTLFIEGVPEYMYCEYYSSSDYYTGNPLKLEEGYKFYELLDGVRRTYDTYGNVTSCTIFKQDEAIGDCL